MNTSLQVTIACRELLQKFIENHTLEQLNTIPAGFKNNIIWNIGHVVVTQQLLAYKLSGLAMKVSDDMVAKYQKDQRHKEMLLKKKLKPSRIYYLLQLQKHKKI